MNRTRSTIGPSLVCWLAALLGSCGTASQGLIIGKWQMQGTPTPMEAEFHRDGTADLFMLGQTLHGTYKLNGDDVLEWTMNGISTKQKVNVTVDRLEITDTNNQTVTYNRR